MNIIGPLTQQYLTTYPWINSEILWLSLPPVAPPAMTDTPPGVIVSQRDATEAMLVKPFQVIGFDGKSVIQEHWNEDQVGVKAEYMFAADISDPSLDLSGPYIPEGGPWEVSLPSARALDSSSPTTFEFNTHGITIRVDPFSHPGHMFERFVAAPSNTRIGPI